MYREYQAPGVDVSIERREVESRSTLTEFHTVFVGTGVTSRNRTFEKTNIRANTDDFPQVTLSFDMTGDINTDMFEDTKFDFGEIVIQNSSGGEDLVLEQGPDGYEVIEEPYFSTFDDKTIVVIRVNNEEASASDTMYNLNVTASNVDADFDLRAIGDNDRFFSKMLFGPPVLEEGENQFYNDIAIAAEIAFRSNVPKFYYLEVPRDYGEKPTVEDFKEAIDKIYFAGDAYRVVALTQDEEVQAAVRDFVASVSNPIDRRETVGFVTADMKNINNHNNIYELVEEVGGFSRTLNNNRICNVYCGESVELRLDGQTYVLPPYFMAAAVASLDAVVGRVEPLSTRRISVFQRINGPRFRPRDWDRLAREAVFIVSNDTDSGDGIIRHQLTTAKSNEAEDQEYSITKNFDVVTKMLRDRFAPYAGRNNVNSGYLERLDATMATVSREIIDMNLARDLEVMTAWRQKEGNDGRNLVTRVKMNPVFPANHLDIYLIL